LRIRQTGSKEEIPEIIQALEGHAWRPSPRLIRYSLNHMMFLEEQIAEIDRDIAAKIHEAGSG